MRHKMRMCALKWRSNRIVGKIAKRSLLWRLIKVHFVHGSVPITCSSHNSSYVAISKRAIARRLTALNRVQSRHDATLRFPLMFADFLRLGKTYDATHRHRRGGNRRTQRSAGLTRRRAGLRYLRGGEARWRAHTLGRHDVGGWPGERVVRRSSSTATTRRCTS